MRVGLIVPTIVITAVAVACSGKPADNGAASTSSNASGSNDTAMSANGGASATTPSSTAAGEVAPTNGPVAATPPADANILAVLHEANQGEIGAAKLALTSSSNPQVKSFAHQMIRDHTKLDKAGDSVAKATNITPAPPANDSLEAHVQQESQTLSAAGKGPGFDKQYMDAQVQDHQTVLAMLRQFEGQAQNPQVKAAVSSAIPIVQGHLDRAKKLSATLGSSTTQS
jgi:putative membrane protein